jgi:hypothetical protein
LISSTIVGGIYTVLKSKAPVTCHEYGDRYTMIGPLSYKTASLEVEALEPDSPELKLALNSMTERGVKYLYGRWLIEGAPKVLLFDTGSVYQKLDEWKGDLWSVAGIPSPPNDKETNEAILFGYLVAWFLGEVGQRSIIWGDGMSGERSLSMERQMIVCCLFLHDLRVWQLSQLGIDSKN